MSDHDVAGRMPISAFARTMLVGFADEPLVRLERLLRRHGHEVLIVTPAQARARSGGVNLVLVSVGVGAGPPDVAGLTPSTGNPAIIAISEDDSEDERLRMLQAGCDDHIPLDCGPVELMARIDAVLRWVASSEAEAPMIEHGPLRIDTRNREIRLDGAVIHLTRKEYDLLHLLATRSGEVVDRNEILDLIWHQHSQIVSRTLDTHVSSLRRKIGRWACVTVKGYGLRIGTPGDTAHLS